MIQNTGSEWPVSPQIIAEDRLKIKNSVSETIHIRQSPTGDSRQDIRHRIVNCIAASVRQRPAQMADPGSNAQQQPVMRRSGSLALMRRVPAFAGADLHAQRHR